MKEWKITFSKVISHTITVKAETEDEAADIAECMTDNGYVEFTQDDIANAVSEIDYCVKECE